MWLKPLFAIVLGEQWRDAGHYAAIILVGSLFAFIATPVDKGVTIRQKHGYLIGWPVARVLLKIVAFAILYYGFGASIEATLWIVVAIRVVMHSLDLYCEWIWSKGQDIFR